MVAWGAPCDNGSPVTAYHLEYSCDQPHSVEVSPLETQYNIVGLKPNTSYRYDRGSIILDQLCIKCY